LNPFQDWLPVESKLLLNRSTGSFDKKRTGCFVEAFGGALSCKFSPDYLIPVLGNYLLGRLFLADAPVLPSFFHYLLHGKWMIPFGWILGHGKLEEICDQGTFLPSRFSQCKGLLFNAVCKKGLQLVGYWC
jgi:hypothetical protein